MQGVAWRQAGIAALGHRQADLDSEWKSSASPIKNDASDRWCTASVFSVLLAFPASQFPKTEQIVLDGLAYLGAAHHPQSNNLDTATIAGSRSLIDG